MSNNIDGIATIQVLCADREVHDKYRGAIKTDLLAPIYGKVLKSLGSWYRDHPKEDHCPVDVLEGWHMHHTKSGANLSELQQTRSLFEKLRQTTPPQLSIDLIESWREGAVKARIIDMLAGVGGKQDLATFLRECADELSSGMAPSQGEEGVFGLGHELFTTSAGSGSGYEWALEEFNVSLGPARPGDFLIVGARPEIGKTTLALSQTVPWMIHGKAKVVFINNEEAKRKIAGRALTIICDRDGKWVEANLDTALQTALAQNCGPDRFRIIDAHGKDTAWLDRKLADEQPDVVIVNRLDKVKVRGGRDLNSADKQERLGLWARQLAVTAPCVVLGILQADATAHMQRKLYDSQLYGSKTAIQGEADAIICMGAQGPTDPLRGIHVTKNKLLGGPRSVESARHAYFEAEFDPVLGRFKGTL